MGDSSPVSRPSVPTVYEYSKDWNAHDFYGKYHLWHMKNPAPVPGTQVNIEHNHRDKKSADVKRFEDQTESRLMANRKRMQHKNKSVEFTTRIHVHTVIGEPSDQAEDVLQENEDIAIKKIVYPDSRLHIARFMKHVSLGRAHYVSFAVTTGYRSINWADSDKLGYTALHIAVSKGHVAVVEELLKYNADANVRSGIGNFPVHDAWVFWRNPCPIRAEREEQEAKTTAILHALLSYGGSVDGPMNDGTTALHIAARLGPISAVKEILGFKANHHARDKKGSTPMDIAAEHGNAEILRLLGFWDGIKRQMINVDFVVQWRHFLKDYEAVIASTEQSVEHMLFELNMQENMRKQDQRKATGIRIDDPYLLQCKHAASFAQKLHNKESAEVDDSTSALPPTDKDNDSVSDESYGPGNWRSFLETGGNASAVTAIKKKKRKTAVQEYYQCLFDKNIAPTPKLDEIRKNKFKRAESAALETALKAEVQFKEKAEDSDAADDDIFSSPVEEEVQIPLAQERPLSKLQQRRLHAASKLALDGKFDMFTARPCTSSALGHSRRTALAPLQGTPEEFSMVRYLTTPTRTRRLIAQGIHNAKQEGQRPFTGKCRLSTLGSYSQASDTLADPSQRQLLYDQLVDSSNEQTIAAARNMKKVSTVSKMDSKLKDSWKGTKVDMNAAETRSLFVDKDMVPPKREFNALQELKQKLKCVQDEEDCESEMSKEVESKMSGEDIIEKREKHKRRKEASLKRNVVYGEGRITSTHMVKKQVQVPWSTVNSRYNISTPI